MQRRRKKTRIGMASLPFFLSPPPSLVPPSPPFPYFSSYPLPSSLFPFLPLSPSLSLDPSPSLRSRTPLFHLGVWGALWAPTAEPQPISILVHFSLQIWHLVATILMIFLRINFSDFIVLVWRPPYLPYRFRRHCHCERVLQTMDIWHKLEPGSHKEYNRPVS